MNVILFDFDGTIADTFDAILAIGNRLADEFGYKPVDREAVRQLQSLNTRQVLKQARVPIFKLPALLRRIRVELNAEIHKAKPISGIETALHALRQRGNHLGIVTSNSADNVALFLKRHHLETYFEFVSSGATLFGKSRTIRRLLKQKNLASATVIYVGDETRDIEAARKLAIKIVSVSWGFNSGEILLTQKPDMLVHQPFELVEAVDRLCG